MRCTGKVLDPICSKLEHFRTEYVGAFNKFHEAVPRSSNEYIMSTDKERAGFFLHWICNYLL